MIDPVLEMIFNQNDTAPVLVDVALRAMAMTSEFMWPPLDPIPPIFCGRYHSAQDIKNAVWRRMERDYTDGIPDEVTERLGTLEFAMQLAQHSKNPRHGTAAEQIAYAFQQLTRNTPAGYVHAALVLLMKRY